MDLQKLLQERFLFFDGGTGSILQAAGLAPGERPELWNISHPEIIENVHYDYLAAGADIVCSNTFGANRLHFPEKTGEHALERVISAGLSCLKRAIARYAEESGRRGFAALDIGPTGRLTQPMGDLTFDEAYEIFAEIVALGAKHGADLIAIETMNDSTEARAALLAAKENAQLPVCITCTYNNFGRLLTGAGPENMVIMLQGLGADAIGVNCGLGPEQILELVPRFLKYADRPIIVNPNAGLPHKTDAGTVYDVTPDVFGGTMEKIAKAGAAILGGCCGTTPDHIAQLVEKTADLQPPRQNTCDLPVVTSYVTAVEIDGDTVLGTRISASEDADILAAAKDGDYDALMEAAMEDIAEGADVICMDLDGCGPDAAAILPEAVEYLQTMLRAPLCLKSGDSEALERAMRIYNGKLLIRPVGALRAAPEKVLPLVGRYGAVVMTEPGCRAAFQAAAGAFGVPLSQIL